MYFPIGRRLFCSDCTVSRVSDNKDIRSISASCSNNYLILLLCSFQEYSEVKWLFFTVVLFVCNLFRQHTSVKRRINYMAPVVSLCLAHFRRRIRFNWKRLFKHATTVMASTQFCGLTVWSIIFIKRFINSVYNSQEHISTPLCRLTG
jgi:hypothetical protein